MNNKMEFTHLGDLRPHKSRINLDSFINFNPQSTEDLKKALEARKQELLKSIEADKKSDLEKGRKGYPIGTVRNGLKKVGEGKWQKVSEGKKKKSEKETRLSLIERLIKDGFSPEEAREKVDGKEKKKSEVESENNKPKKKEDKESKTNFSDKEESVLKNLSSIKPHKLLGKAPKNEKQEYFEFQLAGENNENRSALRKLAKKGYFDWQEMDGGERVYTLTEKGSDAIKELKGGKKDLKKGLLSDSINYARDEKGNKIFNFEKTGKEIKEHLTSCLAELFVKKSSIEEDMKKKVEAAGCEPDIESYNETLKNIKRYSWELIEGKSKSVSSSDIQEVPAVVESCDETRAMREYNDLLYRLSDATRDISAAQLLNRNLNDKSKYKLDLQQMEFLGF